MFLTKLPTTDITVLVTAVQLKQMMCKTKRDTIRIRGENKLFPAGRRKQNEREEDYMFQIDYRSEKPIYEQIIEQFKLNIVKGVFHEGDKVISVRKMASILDITPSTVSKAYAELERQGVIETIRAKGTYIAHFDEAKPDIDLDKVQKKIRSELIDLKHAGYALDEVQKMIAEIYESI